MQSKRVKARIARNKQKRKIPMRKRGLLNDLPACECGVTIGVHNLGVVCNHCHTPVRNPLLRAAEDSDAFNLQSLGRLKRPLTTETLRVRSIDTDLTGDELVDVVIARHERLYKKTPTREETVAEITRIGEQELNNRLRQELVRDRTRANGDPWSELRVVLQPTADDYYNRVLHRPLVRDSKGEREMTETEWDLWKQYQDYLKSGAVEWQPGFAPITPEKEGE